MTKVYLLSPKDAHSSGSEATISDDALQGVRGLLALYSFQIFMDKDKHFREFIKGMVSNTSCSSCQFGEFLGFWTACTYNVWYIKEECSQAQHSRQGYRTGKW
ncbi:hypothetical protein HAX54_043830 [Datura stramonium]|uniref:Uncharacterized protein n=1 Tax=Datura stramonium TaxID=4076 RepID=A0ABS8W3S1_DATST|nr:hypothetical protein [Datura stramonium]MCE2055971.1 hypothetical protein [Datura stramonium]